MMRTRKKDINSYMRSRLEATHRDVIRDDVLKRIINNNHPTRMIHKDVSKQDDVERFDDNSSDSLRVMDRSDNSEITKVIKIRKKTRVDKRINAIENAAIENASIIDTDLPNAGDQFEEEEKNNLTQNGPDSIESIEYITDMRSFDSVDSSSLSLPSVDIRSEINSYLTDIENRYTDKRAYIVCNRMYSIGLDISVSSYTNKEINQIVEKAMQSCTELIDMKNVDSQPYTYIPEINLFNKKKILEYIKRGVVDGLSDDYSNIYRKILGLDKNNVVGAGIVSDHLKSLFTRYADSADPTDLEQFYDVGILMANKPFNREIMILKLNRLIDQRSGDDVIEIRRNKKKQLLTSIGEGFRDSKDDAIMNAYDLKGVYGYDLPNRHRLRKRARIDGILKKGN
jgi:hypothetical protein